MRLATFARRTVAVTAATALLTTGGLASGLLVGSASALAATPVVFSATPDASNNTASVPVTISGSDFVPAADYVDFIPTFTGTEVATFTVRPNNSTSSNTALKVEAPLALKAPGTYTIVVRQDDVDPGPPPTTTQLSSAPCVGCFNVTSLGAATATGVAFGPNTSNTSRGARPLDISGSLFAKGARVTFFNLDCSVDNALTFVAGDPSLSPATGYPSSTSLHGNYTPSANFTPGRHYLRVTNTDNKVANPGDCSIGSTEFFQPTFTAGGVTPATRGAGSVNQTVTVAGAGIRQGSRLGIADLDPDSAASDITVGTSTVSSDGTTISAPVSLRGNASTAGRTVTISGPDGASFSVANAFAATGPPSITSLNNNAIGRGGSFDLTVNGSGLNAGTVFSFGGGGLTAVTKSVIPAGTSAVATVTATADAVLGARSVTATNADGGSATLGPTILGVYPFRVNPAPVPTSIAPASSGKGTVRTLVIQGTDFDADNGMSVTFSGTEVTAGPATVTNGSNGALDTATVSVTVTAIAESSLRDVILTNSGDFGRYVCLGCFGVDSLGVTPAADTNTSTASTLTLTGPGMTGNSIATLTRVGAAPGTGLSVPVTLTGTQTATAVFNLLNEAPGKYNATVTTDGAPLVCSSCFTITGQQPTITAIDPTEGGQGALNLPIAVAGTKFAKGQQITIDGAVVHDVVFEGPTRLTGLVDIPTATATGAKDVKVLTADGVYFATLAGGFTVNAGPTLKTITPAAVGQGAIAVTPVTVTGPGLVTGADGEPSSTLDLGPGITVTDVTVTQGATSPTQMNPDDTLTATIAVSADAATGLRDARVINPDGGGSILSGKFTINPGPKVTMVSPSVLGRGATDQAITITGSNFAADAIPTIAGVEFAAELEVSEDGTMIVVNGTVAGDAPRGARNVTVLNPTDKGFGICNGCFTIADVPSAPAVTAVTPGDSNALVTWAAPADNGGTPITGYVVGAGNGIDTVAASANETSATITGLTPGVTYTFTVIAQNAQGNSLPGTQTATAQGKPTPPATVTVTPGDTKATVSLAGFSANGKPITEFTVQASDSAIPAVVVPATQTSAVVTGLTNGTAYSFTVKAKNDYGYGAFSAASATVVPKFATKLTSTRRPGTGTAGSPVTYSGKLTRVTGGTPVAGTTVIVKLTPDIGNSRSVTATTNASGVWSFRFAPIYNTTVRASYAGDADDAAVLATAYRMGVAPRISRSAPASGATTPASSTLQVKGSILPNKVRRTIGLYNGTRLIARATVASNGSFVFNVRLPRGTYSLRIAIGATPGNVAGSSANFIVRRS